MVSPMESHSASDGKELEPPAKGPNWSQMLPMGEQSPHLGGHHFQASLCTV